MELDETQITNEKLIEILMFCDEISIEFRSFR